jgi:hypothetical protein
MAEAATIPNNRLAITISLCSNKRTKIRHYHFLRIQPHKPPQTKPPQKLTPTPHHNRKPHRSSNSRTTAKNRKHAILHLIAKFNKRTSTGERAHE